MGAAEEEKEGGGDGIRDTCSFCSRRRALVYCRADSAALCLECDRHVHAANTVSSKHPRSLLCDSCRSSPSSIFSLPSRSLLCSACDFNLNTSSSSSSSSQRRPVEPFAGCPSASELASLLGTNWDPLKEQDDDTCDGDQQLGVVAVVRMEDLIIGPTASFQASQAIGIPPLPKDRNFTCGKQREEIIRQLQDLFKSESQLLLDEYQELGPVSEFLSIPVQETVQDDEFYYNFDMDATFTAMPRNEDSELTLTRNEWLEEPNPIFRNDHQMGSSSSAIAPFPDGVDDVHTGASLATVNDGYPGNSIPLTPKVELELMCPCPCPDRDSVISRYKEKRKTRRYDKLIRYESRKARADSRVRIKGRFAKVNKEPKS